MHVGTSERTTSEMLLRFYLPKSILSISIPFLAFEVKDLFGELF